MSDDEEDFDDDELAGFDVHGDPRLHVRYSSSFEFSSKCRRVRIGTLETWTKKNASVQF